MPLNDLWPLGLYAGTVVIIVGGMLGLSYILGEHHRERATQEPYESGIPPTGTGHLRVPVQFYLLAMLFVIFDLEAVFIYAWAVAVREVGWIGFWEMTVFITILFIALFYLWRIGALDWGRSQQYLSRQSTGD
ncbi:MAG: NADH-quinone oxidoreductase subunit A [Nitrospirales bacterium]|nr:MAG: NADH-quinone oxidoreductase subunit A [Nitrospirales bacterium]